MTFDCDRSAVRLHNTVRDAQSKAGALPCGFRGIERFKDALPRLFRHAYASIGDRNKHATVLRFGRDTQMLALGALHGVFGVDHEIEQHLLQALIVSVHVGNGVRESQMKLDADASQRIVTQAQREPDDFVDVDRRVRGTWLARKDQQVANDTDRAVGFALDKAHRFPLLIGERLFEQELCKRRNASKRVVEFVRHAGHQFA